MSSTSLLLPSYYCGLDDRSKKFCLENVLTEKCATDKLAANSDKSSAQQQSRNLATCGVLVTYSASHSPDQEHELGEHLFKSPYRDYLKLNENIDEHVFVSSERSNFFDTFSNTRQTKYKTEHCMCDEISTVKAKFDKKDTVCRVNFAETFGLLNSGSVFELIHGKKVNGVVVDVPHLDDSEQQIIAVLCEDLKFILKSLFEKAPDDATCVTIRCVVHTKYDPCPFCLSELANYFRKEFLSGIQGAAVLASKEFPELRAVPIISSRLFYEHRRHYSAREKLPWKDSYNIADECKIIFEDDIARWEANPPLVLYAVPTVELNKAVSELLPPAALSTAENVAPTPTDEAASSASAGVLDTTPPRLLSFAADAQAPGSLVISVDFPIKYVSYRVRN
uniref:Uncharacterized protein n=1 Tax=Spumella elongata TaxID=89044 RepID=A0A7S3MDV9_9STRA